MSSAALRLRLEGSVPRSLQQAGDEGTVASEFDDIHFVSGAVPGSGAKAGGGGGGTSVGPTTRAPTNFNLQVTGPGMVGSGGGVTLKAIGFTCAGGMVIGLASLFFFGLAVRARHVGIAPRCTARHPNTVHNPRAGSREARARRRVARARRRRAGCLEPMWWARLGRWLGLGLAGAGAGTGAGGDGDPAGGWEGAEQRGGLPPPPVGQGEKGKGLASSAGGSGSDHRDADLGEERTKVDRARLARAEARAGRPGSYIPGMPATEPVRHRLRKSAAKGQQQQQHHLETTDEGEEVVFGAGPPQQNGGMAGAGGGSYAGSTGSSSENADGGDPPRGGGLRGALRALGDGYLLSYMMSPASYPSTYPDEENSLADDADDPDPDDPLGEQDVGIQYRGNPFTGWIPWVLVLSYDTMLRGVPGTGTRRKGMDGSLLRVNIDAIVLFRFHAICLRVAVLATILCIGIVLPLNLTARCHNVTNDPSDESYDAQCFGKDYSLTDYEKTTLKNIPPLTYAEYDERQNLKLQDANFIERLVAAFRHSAANTIWGSAYRRNLGRLYGVVLCSWIITWYAIRVIGREWIDALALRRVYYLETDHWDDRKEDLSLTLLRDDDSDEDDDEYDEYDDDERDRTLCGMCGCGRGVDGADEHRRRMKKRRELNASGAGGGGGRRDKRSRAADGRRSCDDDAHRRDPWIPHPEQRDTVPNVELYSVLVGGLPSLPSDVVDEEDIEAAVGYSRRQSIDWQLAVATAFFDHCVPNQPGFSSSIAAITILPDAPDLARSWRMWYVAAAALRRLRFIRTLIADLRRYNFNDFDDDDDDDGSSDCSYVEPSTLRESIEMKLAANGSKPLYGEPRSGRGGAPLGSVQNADANGVGVDISYKTSVTSSHPKRRGVRDSEEEAKEIYHDMQRRMKYYRDVFGSSDNEDVEALLFQALNYGPEQSAVYSREMAQGAAACCPNGCNEERLRRAGIDELLILERDAVAAVHDANLELQYAQARAAVSVLDTDDPRMNLSAKGPREEMEKHLESFGPVNSNFPSKESLVSSNGGSDVNLRQQQRFDDVSLPEALRMESQLLKKFQQTQSGLSRSPTNEPDNGYGHIVTPTVSNTNRKTHQGENIQTGLPVISEGTGTTRSTEATPLEVRFDLNVRRPDRSGPDDIYVSSEFDDVFVSRDPDHPLRRGMQEEKHSDEITRTPAALDMVGSNQGSARGFYGRNPAMGFSADGKFYLREPSPRYSPSNQLSARSFDESTISSTRRAPSPSPGNLLDLPPLVSGRAGVSDWPPPPPGGLSRRRLNTDSSMMSASKRRATQWETVERIIGNDTTYQELEALSGEKHKPPTGIWKMPTMESVARTSYRTIMGVFTVSIQAISSWMARQTTAVVDDLARESTFAVVTFTSRQAAVAARKCIADGRGQGRWVTMENIPVPPLADAAPFDLVTCRGCCRPVSLSIPKKQQMLRKYFSILLLSVIYIFYTFPISAAAAFADPSRLYQLWPELEQIVEEKAIFKQILAGIVPALLFTLFFALCPVMFKAIANFGSNASSVAVAEKCALNYYWWFMVCTAFSGSSLMTMVLNAVNEGQIANSLTEVLVEIAGTIPTQVASNWINWIIVRTTMTLPLQYMLQVNTFVFKWMGWKCCARCVVGGGPGGPIPYRIYIDSGVVFLCVVSLAPASPLVAPFALLYFLYCSALWRRNCIFVYRPKFDSGGSRWPFLSEMFIWSMFVGQVLLTTMMALKEAVGPAIFAALPIIPTFLFRKMLRHRFLKSYLDAGLLQTSLLDGWDSTVDTPIEKREEFRQFLVDAHKAAYIPICIAGGATNVLTAEPALVMPHANEVMDTELLPGRDAEQQYDDQFNFQSDQEYVPTTQNGASLTES